MIYLASPYTDASERRRQMREMKVADAAAALLHRGVLVYSPIVHGCRLVAAEPRLGHSYEHWRAHSRRMVEACDELWVLELGGWFASVGVLDELALALESGRPVRLLEPPTYGVGYRGLLPLKAIDSVEAAEAAVLRAAKLATSVPAGGPSAVASAVSFVAP